MNPRRKAPEPARPALHIVEVGETPPPRRAAFRCSQCGTILFTVEGDHLVLIVRHHGMVHLERVPLARVLAVWHDIERIGHAPDEPAPPEGTS